MTSRYPGGIDGYSNIRRVRDRIDEIIASDINDLRSAIIKVEQTLGTNPQGSFGTVKEWLAAMGAPVGPAEYDLSGIYPEITVVGIQGKDVTSGLATDGYAIIWSDAENKFVYRPVVSGDAYGDLSGAYPYLTVVGLQGNAVSSSTPTDGYALVWDAGSSSWSPSKVATNLGIINVKDYGAVGNASHDDTAAFNAALAAVPAGGKIYVPAGYYIISSTITPIAKEFSMIGDRNQSFLIGVGNYCVLDLYTNYVQRVNFEDIYFWGDDTNTDDAVKVYSYTSFSRCGFRAKIGTGNKAALHVHGWTNSWYNCSFAGPGLILDTNSNGNIFDNCTFSGSATGPGILAIGGRLNVFRTCTFESAIVEAIIIKKTWDFQLDHCNFEANPKAISFQAATVQDADKDIIDIQITGCSFIDNTCPAHIYFEGGVPHQLLVKGNIFLFATTTFSIGSSAPGKGFVYEDNYSTDSSYPTYNVFDTNVLYNSVTNCWQVEADAYQRAVGGNSEAGVFRPKVSQNFIQYALPAGWTTP